MPILCCIIEKVPRLSLSTRVFLPGREEEEEGDAAEFFLREGEEICIIRHTFFFQKQKGKRQKEQLASSSLLPFYQYSNVRERLRWRFVLARSPSIWRIQEEKGLRLVVVVAVAVVVPVRNNEIRREFVGKQGAKGGKTPFLLTLLLPPLATGTNCQFL